jgi:hypothetical protein
MIHYFGNLCDSDIQEGDKFTLEVKSVTCPKCLTDIVASLETENAELRAALQPFADAYELQHEDAVDYWDSLPEYHQWEAAAETLAKKA